MLKIPRPSKIRSTTRLEAIAHDPLATQTGLSAQLGMAVGGVNWYIKRLVNVGYVKVSHLDRTRLKYHLTPKGMSILTQRTLGYLKRSLTGYNELRQKAKTIVTDLRSQGVTHVYMEGDDEVIDILRLTCIEEGMPLDEDPDGIFLKAAGQDYQAFAPHQPAPGIGAYALLTTNAPLR